VPSRLTKEGQNKPWITAQMKQFIRKKKRLYNYAQLSDTTKDWNTYHAAKKVAQRECRKAHNTYLTNLINPESNYPTKRMFSYIKSQQKDCNRVPALEVNGDVVTRNLTKAEELNKYFSSVFTHEDDLVLTSMS